MKRFNDPWEYFIVDDVFPFPVFKRLQDIVFQWEKPLPGERIRRDVKNQIHADEVLSHLSTHLYPLVWQLAHSEIWFFKVHNKNPNKIINIRTEYNCQSKGHTYEVHKDDSSKICSSVLHVSDTGLGTHMYESVDQYHSTIPWLPNSASMFVNETYKYHSFSSDINYRITLTTILETISLN